MTSKTETGPDWGNRYRLAATERWKAKSAAMGQAVTEAIVEYARPAAGMQVLDLASGTGEPAISLAMRIGAQGHVTALDMSAQLLEVTAERAKARGLTNLTTLQADAHSLPFPDHHFDLATSRFGVMFFREQALHEVRRVLRVGARACFLAWGPFDQPYAMSMMGVVHRHVGGELMPADGPNPFRFGEPGSLGAMLRAAGFDRVEEETRTLPWPWLGTAEELWEREQAMSVAFRPLMERVPAEKWPRIHEEVHAALRRFWDGEKLALTATVVLASGTKR